MARIRVSVVIDRPPADVWGYVEQIERHPEWMRDCVGITFVGEHRRGIGTRFVARTRVLGLEIDDHMEVVAWKPRRCIGVRHVGLVSGSGEFRMRRAGWHRTRFTWVERLTFPLWLGGPLGAWAATPVLTLIWRRSLRELKSRLGG